MSYASAQQMIDRFGEAELIQLTDRANPPLQTIDDYVLNAALNDADAEINGYLQARYTLPLASVPLNIARIARDIARYRLYDDAVTDAVKLRYEQAVKELERISKGIIQLGLDGSNHTVNATAQAATAADAAVFTPTALAGYQ